MVISENQTFGEHLVYFVHCHLAICLSGTGEALWLTLKYVYHACYEKPSASVADFLARVAGGWRDLTDRLALQWGCETGLESRAGLSAILVLLMKMLAGKTMQLSQQRRILKVAETVLSLGGLSGHFHVANVDIRVRRGNMDLSLVAATLFPSLAPAVEAIARRWGLHVDSMHTFSAALAVFRCAAIRPSLQPEEQVRVEAFSREAIRTSCETVVQLFLSVETPLLAEIPKHGLTEFVFRSGASCTRPTLRVRAQKVSQI